MIASGDDVGEATAAARRGFGEWTESEIGCLDSLNLGEKAPYEFGDANGREERDDCDCGCCGEWTAFHATEQRSCMPGGNVEAEAEVEVEVDADDDDTAYDGDVIVPLFVGSDVGAGVDVLCARLLLGVIDGGSSLGEELI